MLNISREQKYYSSNFAFFVLLLLLVFLFCLDADSAPCAKSGDVPNTKPISIFGQRYPLKNRFLIQSIKGFFINSCRFCNNNVVWCSCSKNDNIYIVVIMNCVEKWIKSASYKLWCDHFGDTHTQSVVTSLKNQQSARMCNNDNNWIQ